MDAADDTPELRDDAVLANMFNELLSDGETRDQYDLEYKISIARGSKKTLHVPFFFELQRTMLHRIISHYLSQHPPMIHTAISCPIEELDVPHSLINKAVAFSIVLNTYIATERTRQPIPVTRIKEISTDTIKQIRSEFEPLHSISMYPVSIPESFIIALSRLFKAGYLKTIGAIATTQSKFDADTGFSVPSIFHHTESHTIPG